MTKPFAFLADRLSAARVDIDHDYGPIMFEGERRGFMQQAHEVRPFVIITELEQLRGLEISGWAFVRSAQNMRVDKAVDLHEMAQIRMR